MRKRQKQGGERGKGEKVGRDRESKKVTETVRKEREETKGR